MKDSYATAMSDLYWRSREGVEHSYAGWMQHDLDSKRQTEAAWHRRLYDARNIIANTPRHSVLPRHIASEVDSIRKSKKIRKVIFKNNKLIVYTRQLYVFDNKCDAEFVLGKMKIAVATRGDICGDPTRYIQDMIRIHNLSHPYHHAEGTYPAPHVNRIGIPCTGKAFGEILADLWTKGEYAMMACSLVQFLETINHGEEYVKLVNWPVSYRSNRQKAKGKRVLVR